MSLVQLQAQMMIFYQPAQSTMDIQERIFQKYWCSIQNAYVVTPKMHIMQVLVHIADKIEL